MPTEVPGCTFDGVADVPGKEIWLRTSGLELVAHELAHNIGLQHASSDFNGGVSRPWFVLVGVGRGCLPPFKKMQFFRENVVIG